MACFWNFWPNKKKNKKLIAAQAVCLGYKHKHPELRLECHFFFFGWDAILKNSSGIPCCRCYVGFEPEFFLGSCQPLSVSIGQPLACGAPPGEELS